MADRVPCLNSNCANTILPATAARTGGICMPCVQAAARTQREEFIRTHRHDVNEFAGVSDPVEVLKIVHKPRPYDPLVNWTPYPTPTDQLYTELSAADQRRLQQYAASLVGTDRNDEAETIALCLAAFTEANLDDCLRAFVGRDSFWPSLPFSRSSPDIRDELVERVQGDSANRNHILLALAWVGDPTVVELFGWWRRSPPSWSASMYLPPHDYSREAGWELADDGSKRQLFLDHCNKLKGGASISQDNFKAIVERDDACPWCGTKLTNLLNVRPSAFGLQPVGNSSGPTQVTTCEVCTMFVPIFGFVDEQGNGHWSQGNARPQYLPDDAANWLRLPQDSLWVGPNRPPRFAADQFLPTTFSQLGGHPTWIQNAEYPKCVECRKTMVFLAQIDNHDIWDMAEGMYYAFVCADCRTTATTYQQT
jgi:hypothetical protein